MFTFIIAKYLKLKDEDAKIAVVLLAMIADFWLIGIILGELGIIGG